MQQQALIDPPPARRRPSTVQRLRARQAQALAVGIHPITGARLLGGTETCGTCAHHIRVNGGARNWPKCDRIKATHGHATDCLARFPACVGWEKR